MNITLADAIEYIKGNKKKTSENVIKDFTENNDVKVLNGRYGAYIKIGKDNYKIPKDKTATDLTLEDCLKIAEETGSTSKTKRVVKKKAVAKTKQK